MPDEFFESEQDVGELQAQLEAELKKEQQPNPGNGHSIGTATRLQHRHGEAGAQVNSEEDEAELITRNEFGQLAASVAALHKRSKQREIIETRARTELETAYGKDAARNVVETREFAATQKHVQKLQNQLRDLQNLAIRQNSEIKRLETDSPRHRLMLTSQRIKFLIANLSKRSDRIASMANHSNKIDSILKTKSDNPALAQSLLQQKQKLRVQVTKQKLAIVHERKALRAQKLIFQVQKLPHIGQALAPLQLKAEIRGLRANQQRLSEMVHDLKENGTGELQNLHELQREIHESFRQLKTRIELQEDVLRATSVNPNVANGHQAANDDAGNENVTVQARLAASDSNGGAQARIGSSDSDSEQTPVSRPKLIEPKKSRRILPSGDSVPASKQSAKHADSSPATARAAIVPPVVDNLKRIFGISQKIEQRLNEYGVVRFHHIANLDVQQINYLAEQIGYPVERIEKDGWVDSARQLVAAEGNGNFSKRRNTSNRGDAA